MKSRDDRIYFDGVCFGAGSASMFWIVVGITLLVAF